MGAGEKASSKRPELKLGAGAAAGAGAGLGPSKQATLRQRTILKEADRRHIAKFISVQYAAGLPLTRDDI